ncbi:MAG: signal peptidase II [Angelakisella sp.]
MLGIFYLLGAGVLVFIDYLIKQWATLSLQPVTSIDIIPGILSLYYHQNYGAAFGILQEKRFFLIVVTGIMLTVLALAILLRKVKGSLLLSAFSLIVAGGVGNLIDRVINGYVVDYIYFEPINFPIFNFADCCVVIGTGLLFVYLLFFDGKQKKSNSPDTLAAPPEPPVTGEPS